MDKDRIWRKFDTINFAYIYGWNCLIGAVNNSIGKEVVWKIKYTLPTCFSRLEIEFKEPVDKILLLAHICSESEKMGSALAEFTTSVNMIIRDLDIDNKVREDFFQLRDSLYASIEIIFHNREVDINLKNIYENIKARVSKIL